MLKRFLVVVAIVCLVAASPTEIGAATKTELSIANPKFVANSTVFDFGRLQPREMSSHEFVFRNEGTAPLKIGKRAGSCKCLSVETTKERLQPGEEAKLLVRWRAGDKAGKDFLQHVRVETNDPNNKIVEFAITGAVGGHLSLSPGRIEWNKCKVGEPQQGSLEVRSSEWDAIDVRIVSVTNPGLKVQVVDSAQPTNKPYRSAKRLVCRAPSDLAQTSLRASIDVEVCEADQSSEQQPLKLSIPVMLDLEQAITINGPGYDELAKVIELGRISTKKDRVRNYLIKIRDPESNLVIKKQTVKPDFIEAKFTPYKRKPGNGLYRLELTIPARRLTRGWVGETAGELRLEFDHPRIKELQLGLELFPE